MQTIGLKTNMSKTVNKAQGIKNVLKNKEKSSKDQ